MSSLDRAFFRAYAKEQPTPAPVEPVAEGVSPYVYYEPQRKPQLRYRIEPTHAPWGQTAVTHPHVDISPLAVPDEDFESEAEDGSHTAWSAAGAASLAEPMPAPTVPAAHMPVAKAATAVPQPRQSPLDEGIVCLPGMDVPESSYLAALLAAQSATIESHAVVVPTSIIAVPQPEPLMEPALTPIVRPSLDVQEAVNAKTPPAVPVEPVKSEEQPAPSLTAVVEPTPETAAPAVEETTAFWEVDHFFYPTISDRLLREYDYFSQAGEKLKLAAAAGLKVLGVTGVGRSEGRTTLAICLARAAARAGLKVGLIDCDFQRPLLAQTMGLDVSDGWQSVAAGKVDLAEVAVRSLEDGITFLPLTSDASREKLSFADERVARVLAAAKSQQDVVILDLGPLDPPVAASPTPLDAAIVVWDGRRRQLDEVQTVARALHAAGVEAVGIAENFAAAPQE
jgi:Mrp family chromosome partitioning ATPase